MIIPKVKLSLRLRTPIRFRPPARKTQAETILAQPNLRLPWPCGWLPPLCPPLPGSVPRAGAWQRDFHQDID
jgi:hypothetical protein